MDGASLSAEAFKVTETKEAFNWATFQPTTSVVKRKILDVYLSDEKGEAINAATGKIVTVVMYISPNDGSPFYYDVFTGFNRWVDQYDLAIRANVTSGGENARIKSVQEFDFYDNDQWISVPADEFKQDTFTASDGTPILYGEWAPEEDDQKNALVIWLHGAGEGTNKGKNDNYIDLLGNEVTALVGDEFQDLFGGAYVVTPQAPTMWMDDGKGNYQNGDKGSCYASALFEFIEDYVAKHDDVDRNRIIIGGCSNGGYMTIEMIVKHPTYFYKAYPICEAFYDEYITDDQIKALAEGGTGIWFTYAKTDTTVDYTKTTEPTYARLKEAGAKDLHKTVWDDVHDTTGRFDDEDGKPYEYNGHWSWIYFDNNSNFCDEHKDLNEWAWLAEEPDFTVVSGKQVVVVTGDDWGPSVEKTIITLDAAVDADSLKADRFSVVETKEAFNWATFQPTTSIVNRKVLDVYLSDENGEKVRSTSGKIVTVVMYISPNDGSPFYYDVFTGFNRWVDQYDLAIRANVTSGGENARIKSVQEFDFYDNDQWISVPADEFKQDTFTASDGTPILYGEWAPEEDDQKNALVIWLHGAGEGTNKGKNDNYIDLLGNEVTALVGDEFQDLFGGAYVVTPQAPTMWMDDGKGNYQNGDKGSCYASALFEFIEDYVAKHDDVDRNRIIIGGCSNGGYMTIEMIVKHPTYFYKAYPICEAFYDEYITDDQIKALAEGGTGIWFTYAKTDTTVDYTKTTEPTYARLKEAGAKDLHKTVWDDVHDTTGRFKTDGKPYEYNGHWSWIYFDNNSNECDECGINEWAWLAESKGNVAGSQIVEVIGDDWGPGITKTIIHFRKPIDAESVTKETFEVTMAVNNGAASARTVLDAYVSDEKGEKIRGASEYVTIEMRISPAEGNPLVWSFATWTNSWADPCELNVTLAAGKELTSGEEKIGTINVNPLIDVDGDDATFPQLEGYEFSTYTASDGLVIPYGLYTPENADDGKKHALIIWNHGIGECGTDPKIAILGNEVTALNGEEFQKLFDGAYILVPQTPSYSANTIVAGKAELIQKLTADESLAIDADRVIVGGCSMGGGQTMNLVYNYSELFAAAYPVCPASTSSQVSDEFITNISRLPIWFTHCVNDDTVNYAATSEALIERLQAAGNKNVHWSIFDDVHDTTGRFNDLTEDGSDYVYATHWSWVYFDNNECFCSDENCKNLNEWEWLALQTRANRAAAIELDITEAEMPTESTKKLTATILPEQADQTVVWTSSDEEIATVDEKGVVKALRYGKVTITATAYDNPELSATCEIQTRFYDVNDPKKYYYTPVYWAADNEITTGYDRVYFGPQKNCTRQELAIFLWRLAGKPAVSGTLPFTDTKYDESSASFQAILWCSQQGIVKGYSDGTFKPKANVERKDAMIMLYRLAGKPEVSGTIKFPDVVKMKLSKTSDTYKAILWGVNNGITNGYKDGNFQPKTKCLREHIVTFIYRADKIINN